MAPLDLLGAGACFFLRADLEGAAGLVKKGESVKKDGQVEKLHA